jgi:hypothetical protein
MSATPIADMVERMLGSSTPAEIIVLAVRTIELSARDASCDARDAKALAAARSRRYRARKSGLTEANDAVSVTPNVTLTSRDASPNHCELKGTSDSQSGIQEVRKKNTASVNGRAERVSPGTRLEPNTQPSEQNLLDARKLGLTDDQIKSAWAEFVDYWTGIPGHRGRKLNWAGTWRNRVRQLVERGGPHGQRTANSNRKSGGADFFTGLATVAENIAGHGPVAGPAAEEVPLGRINIDG